MTDSSAETSTLSQEHKEQTSALKKFSWIPGLVYTLLGIAVMLVGWGMMYGGDQARMEAKLDLFLHNQKLMADRITTHEAIDSVRQYGHDLTHKRYSGLFIMIGRRFNFNDRYFEVVQE